MPTDMSSSHTLEDQIDFFHEVLKARLRDPDIMIACGRWPDGACSAREPSRIEKPSPAS